MSGAGTNPFDFDGLPPRAVAARPAHRSRRAWAASVFVCIAAAGACAVYLAARALDRGPPAVGNGPAAAAAGPSGAANLPPPPKVNRLDPPAATPELAPAVDDRRIPPRLRVRQLSPEQQARWDRAQKALAAADRLDLFALHPYPLQHEQPRALFHGWAVIRQVRGNDPAARDAVAAVISGIRPGLGAKCFEPRHGVRATAGRETVDLVICFACSWVYVFLGPDDEADLVILTVPRDPAAPEKVLAEAGVARPKLLSEFDW